MSEQVSTQENIIQENLALCQHVDESDLNNQSNKTFNYFSILPMEILYRIFDSCGLSEQLIAAKVCRTFRKIIRDIFQRKYKFFHYNYLNFKYTLKLKAYEVTELCYLCGRSVEKARFSSYFNMELLKHLENNGIHTNPMDNLKFFINDNFQRNVKYFKNLQELEVEGRFLQDQTILELGKYCKHLKTLRLLDGDNRWLLGENLPELESIENLELKACRNLEHIHLLHTSQKRQLKSLNIVECDNLKNIPKMLKLCEYWQYLETLRLTAFTQDNKLFKAIIDLPNLKLLQFYCINYFPLNFEENFFSSLQDHKNKSLSLKYIKFENDRYYLEDETLLEWTPETYAIMRENVCINGETWDWSNEVFNKILTTFKEFKNLHTLCFHYCRLLSYEQLQQLSLCLTHLKVIKIYGCPKTEDKFFQKQWLEDELQLGNKCQLNFESFLTLEEVMNLNDEANSRQFSSYYRHDPVMHSIECQFS